MLRNAFGDDVIDHYVHAGRWEQEEYDRRVTDWEVARGFERASSLRENIMTMIQNISPIDGSVYAEREAMSLEAARAAVSKARKAQKDWARRPLEDRVQLVLKGVARLNEMVAEVVPELAHMMGRPVRYGGEFKGFNERSNMSLPLRPMRWRRSSSRKAAFRTPHRARGAWRGLRHRAVELSLYDRDQHRRTRLDGRQYGRHQTCGADAAGRRTHGAGFSSRPVCLTMSSSTSSSTMARLRR